MTFPELIKNLLDSSKERLKTPIVGSFMLTFLFYNWRVLAVLFFSKATIEDRIIVINHEYLGVLAYLIPFGIALIYSVGVPYLMKWIDSLLVSVKNARRTQIYDGKKELLDLKIKLADKELELQDKLSRNKDKQEMLDQIKKLEGAQIISEKLLEEREQQINVHQETVAELQSIKLNLSNEIQERQKQSKDDQNKLTQLKNEKSQLTDQLQIWEEQSSDYQNKIGDLEREMQNSDKVINMREQVLKELQKKINDLEQNTQNLREIAQNQGQQSNTYQNEIAELERSKLDLENKFNEAQRQVRMAHDRINAFENERYLTEESDNKDSNLFLNLEEIILLENNLGSKIIRILSRLDTSTREPISRDEFSEEELRRLIDHRLIVFSGYDYYLTKFGVQLIFHLISSKRLKHSDNTNL